MVRASRLSGSLPLSIAVHSVILFVLLVIPLTDGLVLPLPSALQMAYIQAIAAPPPPPAVRLASPAQRTPTLDRDLAPVVAPDRIVPERPAAQALVPELPAGDTSGAIADFGAIGDRASTLSVMSPPPVQKPAAPVRVSELVQPPRKIVDVRPAYPELARQVKIEGTVVMEAILDRSGRVDQLRLVKSVPMLDQAALDAVRQWRYTPSVLNGQPVAVLMTVTIRFTLQ